MAAAYSIGIDLGTTNSVVAYIKLQDENARIELLNIQQLTGPATIENRLSLPSFCYLATDAEKEKRSYDLPWEKGRDFAIGEIARKQAAEVPTRTIAAAKSWLAHSKVDRHENILPWNAPSDVKKISPVEASRRYLEHIVTVWNSQFPDAPIAQQQVVLTVPASFDVSARELTMEAAAKAGLPDSLLLLEEPQAAVYAWLADSGEGWRKRLSVGDTLLVCDIGGGTTDFTLIGVGEEEGDLILKESQWETIYWWVEITWISLSRILPAISFLKKGLLWMPGRQFPYGIPAESPKNNYSRKNHRKVIR